MADLLVNTADDAEWTLVLAHGAGAPMDSPFMDAFAAGLSEGGVEVVRFEFPYMERIRADGKKRPPDREPVLRETWLEVLGQIERPVAIGGKSLGGRVASLIVDDTDAAALICLGYPFHPVGKPEKLRVEHLRSLQTPALILQGERDTFGKREEVAEYDLAETIQLHWLPDGDHSLKPRKASGRTAEENWAEAMTAIVAFLGDLA